MLVPEAPVFHPTPQEFEDPLGYISSIRQHAEAYGICKVSRSGSLCLLWQPGQSSASATCLLWQPVLWLHGIIRHYRHTRPTQNYLILSVCLSRPLVEPLYGVPQVIPPAGWRPPFAIDRKSYRFRTRIQSVHELQQKADFTAASESFNRGFQAWLRSQGKAAKRNPVVAGQEVDLAKLYRLISGRGGFERVNDDKLWRDVARIMQVIPGLCKLLTLPNHLACTILMCDYLSQIDDKSGNAIYTLRQTYQKHLLPYETYCQQRMDPEAGEKGKGKAPATSKAPSRFDAMLAAADDAAEAAEILGSLMSFDTAGSAEDDGPLFKRLKTEDVNGRVRLNT